MRFSAVDLAATVLFEYTGVVVLAAMLQAAWRARHTDEATAARARELVLRHGGSPLSYRRPGAATTTGSPRTAGR
jgi:phosphatidylglycerol lysyltransferase